MTREEAKTFLCSIAGDLGFTDIENYTCKDGEKMREAIKALDQEPCNDCISRQAAIDTIESWLSCDDYNDAERHIMRAMQSVLYDLLPVTPAEKTGRWVWRKRYWNWVCSECDENPTRGTGHTPNNMNGYKYCPNCGAKMREVEE